METLRHLKLKKTFLRVDYIGSCENNSLHEGSIFDTSVTHKCVLKRQALKAVFFDKYGAEGEVCNYPRKKKVFKQRCLKHAREFASSQIGPELQWA